MVNHSSSSGDQDRAISAAQAELLQTVLDADCYPWLSAEMAVDYAARAEAAGQVLEISEAEAAQGWQGLSQQLTQVWGDGIIAQLQQKFANRLSPAMIAQIGEKAQQVVRSGQPMMAQMLACVRDQLTYVAESDLQVMARPMALAMRGNSAEEFVEATIRSVRSAEWDSLTPPEQARLSLAAARYAIARIAKQN